MVSIDTLPREILGLVAELLTPEEREHVALTLNKRLYSVLAPSLAGLFARRRNCKQMIERFGEPLSYGRLSDTTLKLYRQYIDAGLPANDSKQMKLDCLDYLELDGTLQWLENTRHYGWHGKAAATPAQAADIEAEAEDLGLTLPPTFLRFMTDRELQCRVSSVPAVYFELGSKFFKVSDKTDGGKNGYVILFCVDVLYQEYWMLYLDTEGGCCVLTQWCSPEGWEDSESEDEVTDEAGAGDSGWMRNTGLCLGNFAMSAPGFEEYLAWDHLDGGNMYSTTIRSVNQYYKPTNAQLRFCVRSCTGKDTYDHKKYYPI